MAKKVKLTRPELKKHRDALQRFQRYLPMLKLKQQQLQVTIRDVNKQRKEARDAVTVARKKFEAYGEILADTAGVNLQEMATPKDVDTTWANVAGVRIPVFAGTEFPAPSYSLFSTPAWVDRALADLQEVNRRQAEVDVFDQQYRILKKELTKIVQRVNLFEKVMIPNSQEAIRIIRIALGDEMTAAVGRAKIAKGKLSEEGNSEDGKCVYNSNEIEAETAESSTQ
ncbi:MAG: V-type ATP synthase subunit D [Phycisphaerales bacterium]|nr:V-type ATP synthase subunit D [Phycisphaerales bacterium]